MKYTLQQPGRSIYSGTIDIENFHVFNSWRLQDYRAEPDNVLVFFFFFFFFFFAGIMVQSAAIKQGRSAKRKHTYFFFVLADPTIYRPKSKFLIYSTQAAVLRYHPTIFNNDKALRQTANLQCA